MGPIICVSSAKEGKTQVGWVVVVRRRVQRWARTNNVPPNRSRCYVFNSNKMTMKSPWKKTWEKYCEDGCAYNCQTNGKNWYKKPNKDHNSWKMVDYDIELKVLWTSTCSTTQFGCKFNIVRMLWTIVPHPPWIITPNWWGLKCSARIFLNWIARVRTIKR